jgi:formylglycine-generating enzyme required for sulfatase activity
MGSDNAQSNEKRPNKYTMLRIIHSSDNGSSNEKPVHRVTLSDFYMGKFEVTLAQFKSFIDDTGYSTDAEKSGDSRVVNSSGSWEEKSGVNWRHDEQGNRRPAADYNRPVVHVSHNDATAYAEWLSRKTGERYSLPTEAEWEYSARGGDSGGSTIYTYGDDVSKLGDYAWYDGNSGNTTHPVGQKKPNSLGLYDVMGNVREWCGDWYDEEYYKNSPSSDPKGADKGEYRVLRGGSWNYYALNCLLSYRGNDYPDSRYRNNGFRFVLLP